jgi:uncharacterized protein (TIGR03437 family)
MARHLLAPAFGGLTMLLSRTRFVTHITILGILVLLASGVASAQTLTASPGSLFFAHQVGAATGAPPAQSVQVGGTAGLSTTISVNSGTGLPAWLQTVPQNTATTPYTMQVFALPAGLAPRTEPYTGTITISAPGATPIIIQVQLVVSNNPVITINPSSLNFFFAANGPEPGSQILAVTSTTSGIGYSAAASTTSGGNWLGVTPLSGATPSNLTVTVNRTGLAVGLYTGAITIASPGAGNPQIIIPVNFQVADEVRINTTPASLAFDFQLGGPNPQDQVISLTATGVANINYGVTASVETPAGGAWLAVSPASGGTPANLTVSVQPAGLPAGTYNGNVRVTAGNATNSPVTIPVTLRVTADPLLRSAPNRLTFTIQSGGTTTQTLNALVSNLGSPLALTLTTATAAGGNWLSVFPSAISTPANLQVGVNSQGLSPGVYQGRVIVTAPGAANSPFEIPITMIVSATAGLRADRQSLSFQFQTGGDNPASQTVAVTSTGAQTAFNASATTNGGGNWLSVTPATGNTGSNITIATNPAGLGPGLYTGTVSVVTTEQNAAPVPIQVSLLVSNTPLLRVSAGPLNFVHTTGGQPAANQNISVSSTGAAVNFAASATTSGGGDWLVVGPQTGATPATLQVGANLGIPQGTYTGVVSVAAPGVANSPQYVPVNYAVITATELVVAPATLNFAHQIGGTAAAPQTFNITSAGPIQSFSVQVNAITGGNWLSVSPGAGITPATLTATVNPQGLDPGSYAAVINITSPTASNSPRQVPVTLVVTRSLPQLNVSQQSLSFSFTPGTAPPGPQNINVTSSSETVINYNTSATTTAGGGWLQVTPSSGSTPGTVTVSVNTAGLASGTYTGTVTLTSAAASNSPRNIPVTLTIAAVAAPQLTAFVHAATFLPVAAVPGLIVTLGGSNLGPDQLAGITLTPQGNVATETGQTKVLFDDIPSPMIYASARQTAAVVPYAITGRLSTRVVVEYRGVRSNPIELRVVDAAPGIFTQNSSGSGLGAILNQNGSVNSANNAAERGSVIVAYSTGEGQTSPAGVDGQVIGSVLKRPLQQVRARIGGVECQVEYAGSAPGLVSGVIQLNIRVNASVPTGLQPIDFSVGSVTSPPGVTVAIR